MDVCVLHDGVSVLERRVRLSRTFRLPRQLLGAQQRLRVQADDCWTDEYKLRSIPNKPPRWAPKSLFEP